MSKILFHEKRTLKSDIEQHPLAVAGIAVCAIAAFGSLSHQDNSEKIPPAATQVCTGDQRVTVQPGDTLEGLVKHNVETHHGNVTAISKAASLDAIDQAIEGSMYVLPADAYYEIGGDQLTSGETIHLPTVCEPIEK